MVAGEGRFDTALMAVSNGSVLAKGGAEGVQALAIAGDVLGHGSPGVGIVIKIADGDPKGRAKPLVALEVLRGLGALDKSQYEELAKFDQRIITNWRDVPVGALRHRLHLEIDSWEAP
jgi:L-asparaginase